jgi:hypothetical protein
MALLLLQGCAAAALTAGGIAGGAGVNHTLNGIAYKTFSKPAKDVRVAVLKTLSRMQIKVSSDMKMDEGWKIEATASKRTIEIKLEELSPQTTQMRVVTDKENFFKDSATSTEIILQTSRRLESTSAAKR